jgi:hypothetical protein
VTKPFKNILEKEMPFDWEEDQQKPFKDTKNKLLSLPMLKFLDFPINGVLMQDGNLIVFERKKLQGPQLTWPTHEKKLYVMVYYLKTL